MTMERMADNADKSTDFSLVLGGPLFQLFRKAHLAGDALELLRRRILVISLFAWLPLLMLSALEGKALGGSAAVPFLLDDGSSCQVFGRRATIDHCSTTLRLFGPSGEKGTAPIVTIPTN